MQTRKALYHCRGMQPRLYLHGNLPGLLTLAAEESAKLVAGAGFWRLLILMDEPVVEVRRGVGGAVVATTDSFSKSRSADSREISPAKFAAM